MVVVDRLFARIDDKLHVFDVCHKQCDVEEYACDCHPLADNRIAIDFDWKAVPFGAVTIRFATSV